MATTDGLDTLWDQLLSRDIARIRLAFSALSPAEQAAVRSHLQSMATESGWHAEQSRSAQIALQALGE